MKAFSKPLLALISVMSVSITSALIPSTANAAVSDLGSVATFSGHSYKVFAGNMSWSEAESYCRGLGGHLATITSQAEMDFIRQLNGLKKNYNYWLGGSDAEKEGEWKWVTGEAWTYTFWGSGQPDNSQLYSGVTENYLQACYDWDMKWNDSAIIQDSTASCGFICEWDYNVAGISAIDNEIQTAKDKDLSDSEYELLQAQIKKVTSSSLKLTWKKISSADGYIIYGNKCGKINQYQPILTISSNKKTSYTATGLSKGTYYKYFVVAYKHIGSEKSVVTVSKTVHATTLKGKYGNAKQVKITKLGSSTKQTSKIALSAGKKAAIKGKSIKKDKKINEHRSLAYESSNPSIASVSKKGVITAKSKGKCLIYVYAQNGVSAVIHVTVK